MQFNQLRLKFQYKIAFLVKIIALRKRLMTKIVAILNVTPDSFSGDGALHPVQIVEKARIALEAGADILDIGGESTKPDSHPVTAHEEQQRVIPAIKAIKTALPHAIISIDTYRAETAHWALDAGASIINDITAGQDKAMLPLAAQRNCPIVLMHNTSKRQDFIQTPYGNSYTATEKDDFLKNLKIELQEIADNALTHNIKKERIILDPGLGFGKTHAQNLEIMQHLDELTPYPLFVGASRKSFIGQTLGVGVEDRLVGSITCALLAAQRGSDYVRVHDVKETAQALRMMRACHS